VIRATLPPKLRMLGGLVVVVALLSALLAPQAGADSLSQAKAKLNTLLKQIKSARAQQAVFQTQLNALASRIAKVQDEMANTQAAILQTQQDIQQAQADIASQQAALDARARMAYEQGPGSAIELVLGSTSAADLNDRLEILNAAAQSNQDLINALTDQTNRLQVQQNQLTSQKSQLEHQQGDLQAQQDALGAKFRAEQDVVKSVASKVKEARHLIHRLKIQTQIPGFPPSGGGPSIPGVLFACPVRGPHAYTDDFGAPRPGHIHEGVDVMAPSGTPIVAPFPGRVVQSWDPGGGNDVFVYGAVGYVFNAHLSAYGATGNVSTGTVIGYVGSTGDATGPHDHFEFHPKNIPAHLWRSPYGYTIVGTAIDPYPYLNSVC
jgi:murein DD-endopeptidase MepM/ murein hydrolase activator NlpD